MAAIEVAIGDRGDTIRVKIGDDTVRISRRGAWDQRLTREEAWRLAETIEPPSTGCGARKPHSH